MECPFYTPTAGFGLGSNRETTMDDATPDYDIRYLETGHGSRIAWTGAEMAGKPTIVFFPGHGSDMDGTKALAVADWAGQNGFGMIRFDYSGHGRSSGEFLDGTIGAWKGDCLAVLDGLTRQNLILVGSSLGGWLMMLAARERAERIAGLIGIAAAPDFTRDLIWDDLTGEQRLAMEADGRIALPNPYSDEDVVYTHRLVTEADAHLILGQTTRLDCPVRLLHGMNDEEVPPGTAERLAKAIKGPDIEVVIDQDAGHRFSEPAQIDLILSCLDTITLKAG